MANFNTEYNKVILAEGGYVNDRDDAGGETYLGISRKHNPTWKGWVFVDKLKKKYYTNKELTAALKNNNSVNKYAKELYKTKYWDVMNLDDISSQKIAHQMFDIAVNSGISNSVKIMEEVLKLPITGKWKQSLNDKINNYVKG